MKYCPKAQCNPDALEVKAKEGSVVPVTFLFALPGKFHRLRTEAEEQTIWVDKYVTHENYTKETSDNDIAMLHLAEPVMYNKYVLPICLPTRDLAEQELTRNGRQMVVTGWGSTSDVNNNYSTFLSYIEIPMVPRNECAQAMRFAISDNMLCAGSLGDKKDSCSGDSGGPMITKYKDTWFLVGLVSWGEGCGRKEKFGVYTKVSQYLEWIQHHIDEMSASWKGWFWYPESGILWLCASDSLQCNVLSDLQY